MATLAPPAPRPPADSPAPPAAPPADGYTVVARRYRPQQLADLIGQEHIASALANALTTGRIAHAYLFTGARGVGKTSTARILAKCLNCVTGPTPTPCDACDTCLSIMDGSDVDAVEIDGASNNKVEEARDLRSNIGFRPQRARFKVYIIDEVHMLTTGAFNALLKTLEEPPPHVKFVLATTEVQKLPVTILSRCQRFDFSSIGPHKVFETLRHIVAKEGLDADPDALRLVARRAGGSMRDAQTLLDQLLGSLRGRLTAAGVHGLLGTAGDDRVGALADAVRRRDPKAALEAVAAAAGQGVQLGELLDQLIDYWRGLMLHLAGGPDVELPGPVALHDAVRSHAADTTLDAVLAGLDVLTTAKGRLRTSPLAQVVLEVTAVRLARLDEVLSVPTLVQMLATGTGPGPAPAPRPSAAGNGEVVKKNSLAPPSSAPVAPPAPADDFTAVWERVVQALPARAAYLQAAAVTKTGPAGLAIRFPAGYASAYDAIADPGSVEAIRRQLRLIAGGEWAVRVTQEVTKPGSKPPAPPLAAIAPAGRPKLMQRPLFARAADALGATLMHSDDGFDPDAAPAPVPGPAAHPEE